MSKNIQSALRSYHNPTCASIQDFIEDFARPKKIRKLFSRYRKTGLMNHRLVINHIIAMRNVFEPAFFRAHLVEVVGPDYYQELNTFMVFIGMSLDMVSFNKTLYEEIKKEVKA